MFERLREIIDGFLGGSQSSPEERQEFLEKEA